MKPPFVLECEGIIEVRDTLEGLKLAVEPDDVEDGTCTGYDSEGRRINLATRRNVRSRFFPYKEVIASAEPEPAHSKELRDKLLRWLSREGDAAAGLESLELPELIARARLRGG